MDHRSFLCNQSSEICKNYILSGFVRECGISNCAYQQPGAGALWKTRKCIIMVHESHLSNLVCRDKNGMD
jgi:hypothetical protein